LVKGTAVVRSRRGRIGPVVGDSRTLGYREGWKRREIGSDKEMAITKKQRKRFAYTWSLKSKAALRTGRQSQFLEKKGVVFGGGVVLGGGWVVGLGFFFCLFFFGGFWFFCLGGVWGCVVFGWVFFGGGVWFFFLLGLFWLVYFLMGWVFFLCWGVCFFFWFVSFDVFVVAGLAWEVTRKLSQTED